MCREQFKKITLDTNIIHDYSGYGEKGENQREKVKENNEEVRVEEMIGQHENIPNNQRESCYFATIGRVQIWWSSENDKYKV